MQKIYYQVIIGQQTCHTSEYYDDRTEAIERTKAWRAVGHEARAYKISVGSDDIKIIEIYVGG